MSQPLSCGVFWIIVPLAASGCTQPTPVVPTTRLPMERPVVTVELPSITEESENREAFGTELNHGTDCVVEFDVSTELLKQRGRPINIVLTSVKEQNRTVGVGLVTTEERGAMVHCRSSPILLQNIGELRVGLRLMKDRQIQDVDVGAIIVSSPHAAAE